jgi:dihydrolipoamide dehydrogenase
MNSKYDLAIIGGGPGGYVAALRASQLKKKVILFEKDELGGTCVNRGCIPTKYLLEQTKQFAEIRSNKSVEGPLGSLIFSWKKAQEGKKRAVDRFSQGIAFLLKKNRVNVVKERAILRGERQVAVKYNGEERIVNVHKIILAMGSRPADLPFLRPNGKEIITSREALELKDVPKEMLIIGAGAIGLELGTIFLRLGTRVTVLEIMPTILPGSDRELVDRLDRLLKRQGMQIHTHMKILESSISDNRVTLEGICLSDQEPFVFESCLVLLATGRKPNSEMLEIKGKESFQDRSGLVKVNSHLETVIPGIYAVGDLVGGKFLAHKAFHEGIISAENAAGLQRKMDYDVLPMAVFTEPEFAYVGINEEQALERGLKPQLGTISLQSSGRALTMEKPEGLVKVIADEKDKVIGAHILAPHASELIAEMALCMKKGMKLQDISSLIHIHPTLSESTMEAALKAKGEALHVLNA